MYNGYKNYETWSVKLIIDNDYGLYSTFKDAVKEMYQNFDNEGERINTLAGIVKNYVQYRMPSPTEHIWSQILNYVLNDRIDFHEIAKCLLEDHKEEVA